MISLREARDRQLAARKRLAQGIDPMAERKADAQNKQLAIQAEQREAASSFAKIAAAWWDWWSIGKSPRHADRVERGLKADVFPAIGHLFIDQITASDIRELVLAIERRNARDVAKRAHESIGQIFRFAIARGLTSRNSAADFKPRDILAEAKTQNFARVDAKELPILLMKMEDYNGDALTPVHEAYRLHVRPSSVPASSLRRLGLNSIFMRRVG